MPDLLVELFSEEIPARMQRTAAEDLKKMLTNALVDNGLTYKAAQVFWTPRRLSLEVRGLDPKSRDTSEVRKGPSVNAPEAAIAGFLRKAGLDDVAQAEIIKDAKKGDYYVATLVHQGISAQQIIAQKLPEILHNFPWPKSMRWAEGEPFVEASYETKTTLERSDGNARGMRWVRPLHSIVCLFGTPGVEMEVIDLTFGSLRSGATTYGHRFLGSKRPIRVRSVDDYAAQMSAEKVVLDGERRKNIILNDARNLCFAKGVELVEDEALLEEVSGLIEWPHVLMGQFDEKFLGMPPEIIRLTIRANQKCFVTRPLDGGKGGAGETLANQFILISNIDARDGGEAIIKGNERVVRARLSDALYFWRTDQANLPDLPGLTQVAQQFALDLDKPLDQRLARLAKLDVTFHAKLGTQAARILRLVTLAEKIAPLVGARIEMARRAAVLAKADLQTDAVGEFPQLQGLMGHRYALLQGEDPQVARAIEEHYQPQGPNDKVPVAPVSVALALADKIDILIGFWLINEKPTGSKDPYALRRAALGVIRLCLAREWQINLLPLFAVALQNYVAQGVGRQVNGQEITQSLLQFFHERLRVYLKDEGARHDAIEAILTDGQDNFLQVARRVEALIAFINGHQSENLLIGTKRAINILDSQSSQQKQPAYQLDPNAFVSAQETTLFEAIVDARENIDACLAKDDFAGALEALGALREPVDAFFENVLVNDEDEKLRANRLELLAQIRATTARLADFSKIASK